MQGAHARAPDALRPMVTKLGMYELRRQIEYKQRWRGGRLTVAPSSLASMRTYSACGAVRDKDPDFSGSLSTGGARRRAGGEKPPRKGRRQWPAEPDQSAAERHSAPPAAPDEGRTVSAALALLGSGNRAGGLPSSHETGGGGNSVDPTGGAESAPHRSISRAIEPLPDERRGPAIEREMDKRGQAMQLNTQPNVIVVPGGRL
jgi:hypothetical protein